jgi:hypothetical protein
VPSARPLQSVKPTPLVILGEPVHSAHSSSGSSSNSDNDRSSGNVSKLVRQPSIGEHDTACKRVGSSARVEDLKHFMLECPVYDDIRAACVAFPTPVVDWLDNPDCMAMVFAHEAQSSLAHTLYKMKTRRARLLGLTIGI